MDTDSSPGDDGDWLQYPYDDHLPRLDDDDVVYRFTQPDPNFASRVEDEWHANPNAWSPISPKQAHELRYSHSATSIYLGSVLNELGIDPEDLLRDVKDPSWGLQLVSIRDIRDYPNAPTIAVHIDGKTHPAHGILFKIDGSGAGKSGLTGAQKKHLHRRATTIRHPQL